MTTHGPFAFDTENDADCQRFDYTSGGNGQTSGVLISAAGVAADFCHDTNGGNSAGVGPSEAQDAPGGYLYTECSSPGANGDLYTMEFDTVLDAAAEQWQFNFYSMQTGPAIGNNQSLFRVQINENSGGWVTVASFGGSGQDSTDQTNWISRSVDLSESGVNVDSSTLVRIEIETQGPTNAWHGDIGIDTVEIVGTPTAAKDQEAFRFEDDDGTESGSTFLAAQNVDVSRDAEAPFRVRVGTQMVGDPDTEAATLQYKENGDAAAEWRDA
jgi:hypothetical protein